MKRLLILVAILVVGCSKEQPTSAPRAKWIDKVLEYSPAPGQFINTAIGQSTSPSEIVGKKGMLTLGGCGGYVVFKFATPIKNGAGVDFVIHGNAFEGSSEPGVVMVSVDANGNGIADDKWVELKGSQYESSIKNYVITYQKPTNTTSSVPIEWSDNTGGSNAINTTAEHAQSYWPQWRTSEAFMTFSGTRIVNPSIVVNNLIVLPALKWGYVDNFSADYINIVGSDEDTRNSNKFDLDNATEPMPIADFVKVYTGVNEQAGILGESSTEICGAIIINS